jgi:alpha-glucoside transport system substrate-binding protein
VTAFSDSIETQALMTYISGGEWVNEKGKATPRGGFVSANKSLDIENVASPIDKASVEILQNPEAVFRFDGSDLMPGPVGAGSFWKEMTAWIGEDQSTQDTLDNIESSWPAS